MGVQEVKMQEATCDNPLCHVARYETIGEPVFGIHGSVTEVAAGGQGGRWYACSRKCIRGAVVAAIEGSNR